MQVKEKSLLFAAVLAVAAINASPVLAYIASDSASDPAYAAEAGGAWKGQYIPSNPAKDSGQNPPGTDNGGNGFGIWNFTGGYNGNDPGDTGWPYPPYGATNHFIDGVDFAASAYNDLGATAFGLAGYNGFYLNDPNQGTNYAQPQALRPFAQPLATGTMFSADIDTPASYNGPAEGNFPFVFIRFLGATGAVTAELNAGQRSVVTSPDDIFEWRYCDAFGCSDFGMAAGGDPIAPTDTSDGSRVSLLTTGANTGVLSLDGKSVNVTFADGLPTAVRFLTYEFTAEGTMGNPTGEQAFFFDNLRITVPEPSSFAMMLLAGLALVGARMRGGP
jgi:hypothetical protein